MPLFEAIWPDTPSLLLSAYTTGEALHYIRQALGTHRIFQLDELTEIKRANQVMVLRCGSIFSDLPPEAFAYCPDSETRLFVVEQLARAHEGALPPSQQDNAVFAVKDLTQLPSLVLWHFEALTEEESMVDELVADAWAYHAQDYRILEVDTSRQGVLLSYHYCSCSTNVAEEHSPERSEVERD